MQHDDLIWNLIGKGFCSFKANFDQLSLCRNEFNVSGVCRPECCPLANSRYATVKEEKGVCYLCIKTAERCHAPKKMWEKIALPSDYLESLKIIDKNLIYWPEFMINKCKQRYTTIYQYLLRTKKLGIKRLTNMVPIKKKIERREVSREEKALRGAKLENNVKKQLIERLKIGKYDEIYNFDQDLFEQISSKEADKETITKYVEDKDLDAETLNDIEEIQISHKRKFDMIMNVDKQKRLRHRI